MRVTFLGTGAAEGIPQLWCRCDGCRIARARGGRHIRRRTATLINDDLLIDAGPDVALAAAHAGLDLAAVRAVLVTHSHYDHLNFGTLRDRGRYWGGTSLPPLTVYGSRASLELLGGWADPAPLRFETRRIAPFDRFTVVTGGTPIADPRLPAAAPFPETPRRRYEVSTFAAAHAEPTDEAMIFAIRQVAGPELDDDAVPATLLYATDTGPFPEATWAALDRLGERGIRFDVAVIDATFGTARDLVDPRPHMTIAQMIAVQRELARRGLLAQNARRLAIHFSHSLAPPHDELTALLAPERIAPAYDGLSLAVRG